MAQIIAERYQIALVIIAIVVVIYLMILALKYFGSTKIKIRFPPWISPCPDYWTNKGDGLCCRTVDDNGEGNGNETAESSKMGTDGQYSKQNACAKVEGARTSYVQKCEWARENNIHWSGISDVPCNTKSFTQYTDA